MTLHSELKFLPLFWHEQKSWLNLCNCKISLFIYDYTFIFDDIFCIYITLLLMQRKNKLQPQCWDHVFTTIKTHQIEVCHSLANNFEQKSKTIHLKLDKCEVSTAYTTAVVCYVSSRLFIHCLWILHVYIGCIAEHCSQWNIRNFFIKYNTQDIKQKSHF